MKDCCDYNRRDALKLGAMGLLGGMFGLSLTSSLFLREAYGVTAQNPFYDYMIEVYFNGGPSQTDTFDPKPGSVNNYFNTMPLGFNDKYGKPVLATENVAQIGGLVASGQVGLGVVRSMYHTEGDHPNATALTHCFWHTIGPTLLYPNITSVMAHYFKGKSPIGIDSVAVNGAGDDTKGNPMPSGFPGDAKPSVFTDPTANGSRYDRRKRMVDIINRRLASSTSSDQRPDQLVQSAKGAIDQAYSITKNGKARAAFDLTGKTKLPGTDKYFVDDLTLAQELVKAGVPYVLTSTSGTGGYNQDSHGRNIGTHIDTWRNNADPGIAQMIKNLAALPLRGLIFVGGEFGRTPYSEPFQGSTGLDARGHWNDGFSWTVLSINQPKFRNGAWGDTGPDGLYTAGKGTLVDPVQLKDFGAFLYKAMGFQVGSPGFEVPLVDGPKPPVDPNNKSDQLLSFFGLV